MLPDAQNVILFTTATVQPLIFYRKKKLFISDPTQVKILDLH